MQSNTGKSAFGQSQLHSLDPATIQWRKDVKKERGKENRKKCKQWYVTSDLAALVDIAVGTCEGGSRKGLRIADRRVFALLALSGWKVDQETWTMVQNNSTAMLISKEN